jgi:hypothetical protein
MGMKRNWDKEEGEKAMRWGEERGRNEEEEETNGRRATRRRNDRNRRGEREKETGVK